MQLLWKREILLAEAVLNEDWHSLEKILATDIDVWYGKCGKTTDLQPSDFVRGRMLTS